MKKTWLIAALCLSAIAPVFADDTNVLSDDKSRLSYAIGMYFADRWKAQGVDVDPDLVLRGLKDGQSGGPTLMSQEAMQEIINQSQRQLAERQQRMREETLAKNKAEGEAFLAKNKSQPGVVTLPDGLQYKVLKEGTGETPGDNEMVEMNLRGTFVDGSEFDSSASRGKPIELPVGQLPRGWSEALKLMKAGSKWRLFIPSNLAYGENGLGSRIPGNETLILDVELLSVVHPPPVTAPPPAANPPLTSDIIKVQGTNVQILTPDEVQKLQQSQSSKKN